MDFNLVVSLTLPGLTKTVLSRYIFSVFTRLLVHIFKKAYIMSSGLKLIKNGPFIPIHGQKLDYSLLAGSNGYI